MAYFTIDDVRAGMPGGAAIDDQASFPAAEWVAEEIEGVTDQIDASLKKIGVTMPIADASALGVFKIKGAREVRYQVMAMRATAKNEKVEPLYFQWHEEFLALLEQIEEEGIVGLETDSGEPWSHTMNSTGDFPSDPLGPAVLKDRVF